MYEPTTPSAATRPSFFFADASPRSRRISLARSSLPSASINAFLHSIMPAPVFSRSALTAPAVTSAMVSCLLLSTFCFHENAQPGGFPLIEAALADSIDIAVYLSWRREPPRSRVVPLVPALPALPLKTELRLRQPQPQFQWRLRLRRQLRLPRSGF